MYNAGILQDFSQLRFDDEVDPTQNLPCPTPLPPPPHLLRCLGPKHHHMSPRAVLFVVLACCAIALVLCGEQGGAHEGGASQKELGKGPDVVDLQRCWGFPEQRYKGRV